jgi:hypothetical protein
MAVVAMTARFVGGPLDCTDAGSGRSTYRDEDGRSILAVRGDREWIRRNGGPRRFYARQHTRQGVFYVHASVWATWRDANRRRP